MKQKESKRVSSNIKSNGMTRVDWSLTRRNSNGQKREKQLQMIVQVQKAQENTRVEALKSYQTLLINDSSVVAEAEG